MTGSAKGGLIHATEFATLKKHNFIAVSKLFEQNFTLIYVYNRKVLLPNFKAVGQTQAELHSLKVEKLEDPFSQILLILYCITSYAKMIWVWSCSSQQKLYMYSYVGT